MNVSQGCLFLEILENLEKSRNLANPGKLGRSQRVLKKKETKIEREARKYVKSQGLYRGDSEESNTSHLASLGPLPAGCI